MADGNEKGEKSWWEKNVEDWAQKQSDKEREAIPEGPLRTIYDIQTGAQKGVYNFAKGFVEGVIGLARMAINLVTDPAARAKAWELAKQLTLDEWTLLNPFASPEEKLAVAKRAGNFGKQLLGVILDQMKKDWDQAKKEGKEAEVISKWTTQGVLEIGSLFIGVGEAKAVGTVGKGAELANELGKAGKIMEGVAEGCNDAAKLEKLAEAAKAEKLAQEAVEAEKLLAAAKAAEAARAASKERLAAHYKEVAAHQAKYEAKLAEAEAKGASTATKGGIKAQITEAKGEKAAAEFMEANHKEYEMVRGFDKGGGFDQVFIKRGPAGEIEEIMIVEAKGPGAKLQTGAKKGDQMTKPWVKNSAEELANSADAAESRLGKDIKNALEKGPPPKVTGKVLEATEGGGAVERAVPGGGAYN